MTARRRRILGWSALAGAAALAAIAIPPLLRFDRVEIEIIESDRAAGVEASEYRPSELEIEARWGQPFDFRYRAGGATYRVSRVVYRGFSSIETPAIYCNRAFPRWWRWSDLPAWVGRSASTLGGVAFVAALMIAREATRRPRPGDGPGR